MHKLLDGIQGYLVDNAKNGDYTKIVKTFKTGYANVSAQFPLVTVIPETAQVVRRFSGMRYDVVRSVVVYIYTKEASEALTRKRLQGISREVREVLQTNFFLRDGKGVERTFGMSVGKLTFSDVTETKPHYIGEATLPVEFISKGEFSARTPPATLTEGTNISIMNAVENTFRNNWRSSFPDVKAFVFWQEKLIKGFPAIGVFHTGETTEPTHAGADTISRQFTARVVGGGIKDSVWLEKVCDLAEDTIDFVHQYNTWDGTVYDTECSTINYDISLEGGLPVFSAEIPFVCKCREGVTYNA